MYLSCLGAFVELDGSKLKLKQDKYIRSINIIHHIPYKVTFALLYFISVHYRL